MSVVPTSSFDDPGGRYACTGPATFARGGRRDESGARCTLYCNQLVSFWGRFGISAGGSQVKGFKLMKKKSTRATHEFIIKLTNIAPASHRGSSLRRRGAGQSRGNALKGARGPAVKWLATRAGGS